MFIFHGLVAFCGLASMFLAERFISAHMGQLSCCCRCTGGYAQRIFVKQVTKVLEDLLAALKTQE